MSLLRQRARPYLFSNSLPPAVVGCASKALDMLMEDNTIVQSMAAKTQRCSPWRGWERLGWELLRPASGACPAPAYRCCLCSHHLPRRFHWDPAWPLPSISLQMTLGLPILCNSVFHSLFGLFLPLPGSPFDFLTLHLCLAGLCRLRHRSWILCPSGVGVNDPQPPSGPVTPCLCPQVPQ